ncbi:MAG: hypothetical protein WB952_01405 [Terriglobales bacterium]
MNYRGRIDSMFCEPVALEGSYAALKRDSDRELESSNGQEGLDIFGWSAGMRRRGNTLTFSAPGQPVGDFVPFYKVGAGVPYNMYFDLLG